MANRPLTLKDYIGQERIKTQLAVTLGACKKNSKAMPHMLLYGNPGLGKTTLAEIIANEYGSRLHVAMGGNLNKPEDVQALLAPLSDDGGDIVFIDEIHRMPIKCEEMLYTAMEDFEVEIGGERFWIPNFTMIGATTLAGDLSRPLRDRFGLHFQLQNYQPDEVGMIIQKLSARENTSITDGAIQEIAKRAKGVARIAINFYSRCKEFADFLGDGTINEDVAAQQFSLMGIDEMGLDENDYRVLNYLATQPRPVGIAALSTGADIDMPTITNMIEPYLVQTGMINRTRSGREITQKGKEWIGVVPPQPVTSTDSAPQRNRLERLRA
ncbi:Holliday junction branch migration DNA helicase RuvB [Paenibacillus illinoisensis]|uniref:Holliday junction branch migration DNA helicase RuvB n=1 Tax=Paenibacillus illinoisensis TaxID=59845 RepID=UPI00301B0ABA